MLPHASLALAALQNVTSADAPRVLAEHLFWWVLGILGTGCTGAFLWGVKAIVRRQDVAADAHARTAEAVTRLSTILVGVDGNNGVRGEVRELRSAVDRVNRRVTRSHRLNNRRWEEQLRRERDAGFSGVTPPAPTREPHRESALQPRDVGTLDRRAEVRG